MGEFWRGRRVFVTGHTGFKGSWLCLLLHRLGAEVKGYSLPPPTQPSLHDLARVGNVVASTTGDIRDHARLAKEMQAFAPDVVLHMAAQSVVLSAYEDPIETFSTNVVGTASVLNAVRSVGGRCAVVNVTTDKVYENRGWVWGYRETDALGGRDPYSSSKACAELVARSFRESYFQVADGQAGLASARAGNVIGGGDWTPHQLIPDTVAALARGEPVVLRNPAATRPWQHVLDCLAGYLALAEALHANPAGISGDWNFGPAEQEVQPVARVVELLAEPWGVKPAWVRDTASYPHEAMELSVSPRKANRELGWGCRLALTMSLAWTAAWYRDWQAGGDARKLCEAQIEQFIALGNGRSMPS
jgi:CDP-glucose 4,6-dehydratase